MQWKSGDSARLLVLVELQYWQIVTVAVRREGGWREDTQMQAGSVMRSAIIWSHEYFCRCNWPIRAHQHLRTFCNREGV